VELFHGEYPLPSLPGHTKFKKQNSELELEFGGPYLM
jgi:hypothetical protein